ncbi:MAG TPA: hypothetical protein VMR06_02590 [Dokdonella sp.]|uniref:hypothetical protein n=1 Tax=Dokdonella sp. TaxID=2291710 RepID=UPI002BBBF6E3|nr:hypothetical protein [Dokdonella sp.]HUD40865.1 hypothetical protein [Dokdonella sp.]
MTAIVRHSHTRIAGRLLASLWLLPLLGGGFAAASDTALAPDVSAVRDRWAEVAYEVPKADRQAAYEALVKQAAAAREAHPGDVPALIWEGIVLSSYAGERGGIGALGLVKQARKDFEEALAAQPDALNGAAYTSLGALYYQVPGWPIGFGNDETARKLLNQGLAVNPDGIDSNYFYGDFLRDQHDYVGAAAALEKALAAPPRPGRELADRGRREQATAALAEVRSHLASR